VKIVLPSTACRKITVAEDTSTSSDAAMKRRKRKRKKRKKS